ncbi:MAG: hypothetical protein JXR88_02000 [Clostridia bacterium]|nr:hypothetical protein [Clostridia bacterium]
MTDQYFYDTDCISSFLWVNKENLLLKLFPGRIIVPNQVYKELSHPSIPHIGEKINKLKDDNEIEIKDIVVGSEEYKLYIEMTLRPDAGVKTIGDGEAAALAHAKVSNGIVASNNLRDVMYYVEKYDIKHITTGDILKLALKEGFITEDEGNVIWKKMIQRRRKLPTVTFSEYLLFKD